MRKRRYTGILARRIPRSDEAARQKALEALCAQYGVAVPKTLNPLTEALLGCHVPAFSPPPQSKEPPKRSGRKRLLSAKEIVLASSAARKLVKRKGIRRTRACELVWRKEYSKRCGLGTFLQNVSRYAVDGPPIGATAEEIAACERGREEAIETLNKHMHEIGLSLGMSPEQIDAFWMKMGLSPEQIRMKIEN